MPFAGLELYGIANCHLPCQLEPWNYIGQIKRSFSTRKKEHIRNTKQCKGSNVAKHASTFDHVR